MRFTSTQDQVEAKSGVCQELREMPFAEDAALTAHTELSCGQTFKGLRRIQFRRLKKIQIMPGPRKVWENKRLAANA